MGNVALGGSKRQSYSPGEAKGTGQAAAVPENGNGVKTAANGQVGGAGKDDVTEQHDVIVADDNSGSVTPSSTVAATPTTSSPGSPLSPAEKKTKRKVPRFVFSLRRTGSGKRSRKPRTEANGVRPVSYPAALGISGSNPATNEKGRPQSLLFEEITIPEDDGKIETVSLSSNDDNTERDRSKDRGGKPSSPTSSSPKTPTSKKDKKKESSQKTKSSKKKKEKESKPKPEKQRKGSKDQKETSPEESPQEKQRKGSKDQKETSPEESPQEKQWKGSKDQKETSPEESPQEKQRKGSKDQKETSPEESPQEKQRKGSKDQKETSPEESPQEKQQKGSKDQKETSPEESPQEKQRKGSKDQKETSPEESPQERKKSVEENIAAVVISMEENIPSGPNEEKAINEEVFVATSAQAEETLPSAPKNETPLVQEVMVVEVVKPNEQTPESKTEESEPNRKAEDIAVQLKSSQVELKESQPEEGETLTKQDEENAAVETETKQEEISEIKPENKIEHTEETDTQNDDKIEEGKAVSIKQDEGKSEEVKAEAETEEPKSEEAKGAEIGLPETSNLMEEEDKETIKKETAATEELVGMVIQPSVAAMPNTEMKIEEHKLEIEHATVTADILEALLQPQADTEQKNESQAEPDSQTTIVAAVVEESKQDLELMATGPEAPKDPEDEINTANNPSSETIQTDVTQIVPVTQDSTELTETSDDGHNGKDETESVTVSSEKTEPFCQETAKLLRIRDGEDVSGNEKEEKIVEEVIEETMSVQVHARVHSAPAQPAAEIKPEQQETTSQLPLFAESSHQVLVNEADGSMEQNQAPDSEKEAQATAVSKEVAESMNLNPPASFISEGEIQTTEENSPPLSPSQIKALEKERKAAKKREEKEKARKEKEEKKRLKELKKQEAKEKKLKEKEEKERKLRELRDKGKAVVAENTEVKTEETLPEMQSPTDSSVTGYVPCSPVKTETKPEEHVSSSSEVLATESPTTSAAIMEVKQEEMDTVDASLQNVEPKTEAQLPHEAEMTPTPALSLSTDNAESSPDTRVEPIGDKPLSTDNQDTVTTDPASDENVPRQSTSSTSSSSGSSSCPPTPASPNSPFSDPQSPEASRSGDSAPTSPTSPDTNETARSGALKKIELGPRLRTAILRKSSSGAESEEKRVSLTPPRFVQTSQLTPPPRKQRPRRPLEQVWSPLGDYASNRVRNAKSSAQKEASAVIEEAVVVTTASNTESAHVETSGKAEDKSTSHRTEAADIAQQQISVTASVDTETKSTSAVQTVSPESESSNLGAEIEESMTVLVASTAESVPAASANVETNQPQEAEIKQSSEKSAFIFETPPQLSSTENADDSHQNEVTRRVKPDNGNDYKVMCDMPSSGSRVSIHSDPSSPTIVSVASIVLSGQPETPDTLSPSDSPHQPPELQKPDDEHRKCEPENIQKKQESEVNADESIPLLQETADAGLQAMAEDMVSQANEEAQVEVVKFISEEKADQSTGHVTENVTAECDISDQVADVQCEDIEQVVNVNCDVTGLTNETTESQQSQTHSEDGVVRDDDMGMVCVGGETLTADCEKTPTTEENKVQQSELEGCGSSMPEETVTVTVESVVSSTSSPLVENQFSSAGACVSVSDLPTEGVSIKVDDCSETKDCPKKDVSDMEMEPSHSSQLDCSQRTAALQASIAVHPQSENMITSEEEEEIEEPPSGTPCVLIPDELLASLKKEAEMSAESEGKVSTENEVQMEVETTIREQLEDSGVQMEVETTNAAKLEDSGSKPCTENKEPSAVSVDADVTNTEEHQCVAKNDQAIIVAADEHKADLETREPDTDTTVQSFTTPEKNSGEAAEDQQCPEQIEQRSEDVPKDKLEQDAESPADQDIADPKAEILADVSSEAVDQHLNGDEGPKGHDEQEENKAGGEREGARVTAQCNGSHKPQANSSDTIDAYLKLQAGAEEVQKNVHVERLQGGDVTGTSTRAEAGVDETDKAVCDVNTNNSND